MKPSLFLTTLTIALGCSTTSETTQEKPSAVQTDSIQATQPTEDTGQTQSAGSSPALLDELMEIPNELIGISHDDEDLFPQYFELIKGSQQYDLAIKLQDNLPNFLSFTEPVKQYDGQKELNSYIVSRVRRWQSDDRTVIGFVRFEESTNSAYCKLQYGPKFFERRDGTWTAYEGESYLPVAFASEIFLSPYDERMLVYNEDEVGQKGEYLVTWQNGKFELYSGDIPFISYDFQKSDRWHLETAGINNHFFASALSAEQVASLDQAFSKKESLQPTRSLLFPQAADPKLLFEQRYFNYILGEMSGIESITEVNIEAIEKQEFPGLDAYIFTIGYEAEVTSGELVIVRTMKNRKWISEVASFQGEYAGAYGLQYDLSLNFTNDSYMVAQVRNLPLPFLEDLWFSKLAIPWEVKDATTVTRTKVRISNEGGLEVVEYDREESTEPKLLLTEELRNAWSDERGRLDAYDEYIALVYEQYTEGDKYGQFKFKTEQQLQGEIHLNQLYREATGSSPIKKSKAFFSDSASIVVGLRSVLSNEEPKIQRLAGDVFFYEGDEYSVLFNTLTMPSSPGDYFDDAFDQLKSRFYNKFDMVRGSMEELPDLTGDGRQEFLLTDQGGYNTTINKSYTVYSLSQTGVFAPLVDFNTTFEGGLCETPLGTDLTLTTDKDKLILTSEVGKDNRPAGDVIRKCESKFFKEIYQWNPEKKNFERISFQEIKKPN